MSLLPIRIPIYRREAIDKEILAWSPENRLSRKNARLLSSPPKVQRRRRAIATPCLGASAFPCLIQSKVLPSRRLHTRGCSQSAPTFKDRSLWLWTAKSVKISWITHAELAMPFDDEFASDIEEGF